MDYPSISKHSGTGMLRYCTMLLPCRLRPLCIEYQTVWGYLYWHQLNYTHRSYAELKIEINDRMCMQ